jgi:putative membrane protein
LQERTCLPWVFRNRQGGSRPLDSDKGKAIMLRRNFRIPKITTVAVLSLIIAGCNSSDSASDMSIDANLTEDTAANAVLGGNEMAGTAAMPTDANGFATAVAASDMFEIESGKLAQDKAASADLKSFGQKLVTDHSKSTADLKSAAATASVTVAPALDGEKQAMLDQLKAASGADFDRLFIDQQTTAHQKALDLLNNYSVSGDNQALKDFASKATPVVQAHLDHVKSLKK